MPLAPRTPTELAALIDHTLLRPDATRADLAALCGEARTHGFHAVCVHGCRVIEARHLLEDSLVQVGTVVGFPFGAADPDAKRYETELAVDNGAQELDVVLNIGRLKEGDDRFVLRELRDIVEAADERPVKVILETGFLTREEILRACHLVKEAGAAFAKTSTGFGPTGASVDDVRLMRDALGPDFGLKAAGGIRQLECALALLNAGANRLGTSAGVALVNAMPE
jgi:deoxyribose-phosphate aldolase